MSYPVESERGITFAMQWSLLNIGAALGGLITLVQTLQNGNQQAVGTGTYVAFVVIVLVSPFLVPGFRADAHLFQVGIAASTLLVSPRNVFRKDGTPVMIEGIPTWKDEVMSIFKLVTDWKIMVLTPAFLASNWFYA